MWIYLLLGLAFYSGVSLARLETFKKATLYGILRGILLGVFLWPIAAILLVAIYSKEKSESKEPHEED
jgi:hypothetical protein